jgi:hypothetical protein
MRLQNVFIAAVQFPVRPAGAVQSLLAINSSELNVQERYTLN